MAKKRANRYHHGDLARALLAEAVRTIHREGVQALTLRSVGHRLGVSRTAMYRHFADKSALLAAVAREGFRVLRLSTQEAWDLNGRGLEAFAAMGQAYVRFAVENPSHYRVMFGGFVRGRAHDIELAREGEGAFQVLVNALIELQQQRAIHRDDPLQLAQYIWSTVHGISMLAIDGLLRQPVDQVVEFSFQRLRAGIETED